MARYCQSILENGSFTAMARTLLLVCVLFATTVQAQRLVPIGGRSRGPISTIVDSPEIRKLISEEEKRRGEADRFYRESHSPEETLRHTRDLLGHPDQMLPGHKDFLDAMAKAPSITIPGKTRARVLEESKARCFPDGVSTTTFVRFVINGKKPPGGTEVWLCTNPYAFDAP
jgi:hypothetical protein